MTGQADTNATWGDALREHPLARVAVMTAAFTLLAGVVQQWGGLPATYDWLGPLDILLTRWRSPWFPTLLLGALAFGAALRPRAELAAAVQGGLRRHAPVLALGAAAAVLDHLTAPEHTAVDAAAVALAVAGVARLWPRGRPARAILDLLLVLACFALLSYGYTVLKAMLFRVRAPYDEGMVAVEQALLGFAPHRAIAAWGAAHPGWVALLDDVYFRLFDHMIVASAFLMAAGRTTERWRLLGALGVCYVLGAFAYYAWPGLGPAFRYPEEFGFLATHGAYTTANTQRLLALNTSLVQGGHAMELQPYAYIACMPSLHIAHELVMLWFARASRPFFALSAVFSALTVLSTFVLGWHYPIDALGGAALAAVSVVVAVRLVRPARAAPEAAPARITRAVSS